MAQWRKDSLIHPVVFLTIGSKLLPKRSPHILRSKASSFKWEYPLTSLRSSSSFLRLLPCLLVTSISPFIFPSITCFRRQFLRKMWPIQLAWWKDTEAKSKYSEKNLSQCHNIHHICHIHIRPNPHSYTIGYEIIQYIITVSGTTQISLIDVVIFLLASVSNSLLLAELRILKSCLRYELWNRRSFKSTYEECIVSSLCMLVDAIRNIAELCLILRTNTDYSLHRTDQFF